MKLIHTKEFNGYPVIDSNGPLVYRILIGNEMVLNSFLSQNKDIVVMFFVLKFPSSYLDIDQQTGRGYFRADWRHCRSRYLVANAT